MPGPKPNTIIINATEYSVSADSLTYEQLVALAFPNTSPDPNVVFKITFSKAAQKPAEGALGSGGSVQIKHNGTQFDVTPTNRS